MKFISWNVNGLRACVNKGFLDSFYQLDADFFCLQETKLQEGQITLDLPGYYQYWNYAQKKGYSGTAIFTKHKPLDVVYGLGVEELDTEGRLITLEYDEFYLVTCYTPNAQRELARIEHRMRWESALLEHLVRLDSQKPVIYCGDLNVAHQEIDLKNPASNRGNAGFSDQERSAFSRLLDSGFTDTFRYLYPDVTGAYSWWSYMFKARQNNAGWRIDYFVVSDRLQSSIADAQIYPDIMGSDHCPVGLDLNTTCNGSIWSDVAKPPETKKSNTADRESPVGSVITILKTTTVAATVLSVILGAILLFSHPDTRTAVLHSETEQTSELIEKIQLFTRDAEIALIEGTDTGTYYRLGMKLCKSVEPLINWAEYDRTPSFFALITFSDDYTFTPDNLPQIQYGQRKYDMYFYEPYITHQFYYGKDKTVEGCILMADLPEDTDITLTIRHANQITTCPIHISIEKDNAIYSNYTTQELVDLLQYNGILRKLAPYYSMYEGLPHFDLDFFVANNACAAELFTRDDALEELLAHLSSTQVNPESSYIPIPYNILLLLGHEQFQSQMNAEQRAQYEEWDIHSAQSVIPITPGEILYGGDIVISIQADDNT